MSPDDTTFEEGDYVVDVESTDPDVATVLRSTDQPISNWLIDPDEPDGETVADQNSNYDPGQRTILVAFVESGLEREWPEWRKSYPELYDGAIANGVKFYPFPEERLMEASVEEIAAGI